MFKAKLFIFTAFLAGLMLCLPVFAQTEATSTENPVVTVSTTETVSIDVTTLTVKNAVDVIGPWGIFWQGVKEQFALLTTLDPVTKMEKMTQFAEERMHMAEAIAEKAKDNPVLQKRAQQMMEKAEKFMQKVVDQKDKAVVKQTERVQKVLQKAAEQALNRQEVINKLEEKLSPESMQKLEAMRTQGLENSQRLINAIGNENISSSTKAHLEEIKAKIETHLLEIKTFVEEKKVLLEKAQAGDKTAIEELKKLRQEKIQNQVERENQAKALIQEKKEVRNDVKQEVKEIRKSIPVKPIICTQEAKVCPDGSSVGRTGLKCDFAACPTAAVQ